MRAAKSSIGQAWGHSRDQRASKLVGSLIVSQATPRPDRVNQGPESGISSESYTFQPNDQNGYTPIDRASISKLPRRSIVAKALLQHLPDVPLRDRDDVKFLQQALIELGLMDAKAIRFAAGNYGQRTTTAVSEIQASLGRPQTGQYDEDVRGFLLNRLTKMRDAPSDRGRVVSPLSDALRKMPEPPPVCTATLNYTDLQGARVPRRTQIRNARHLQASGELGLHTNGFSLAQHETILSTDDFYYNKGLIQTVYYKETEELVKRELGADRVFVLSHQVRNGQRANEQALNAFADGSNVAPYAGVVHTDFTGSKSAEKFYRVAGIPAGVKVRYVLLNTWRNIHEHEPVYNNALACLDASSIANEELVRVDELLKPGAACRDHDLSVQAHRDCAEQYRLTVQNSEEHRWFYFPRMTKREVLLFKQFDSDPAQSSRFTFHSAFADAGQPAELPPRQSVETRVLALFVEPAARELAPTLALQREPTCTLQSRLAARAARGLLAPGEVEALADGAALQDVPDEEVLHRLARDLKRGGGDNARGLPPAPLRGGRGEAVLQLQLALIELGVMDAYAIKYNAGAFGPETSAAVKFIQKHLNMPRTGEYDDAVRVQLMHMLESVAVA